MGRKVWIAVASVAVVVVVGLTVVLASTTGGSDAHHTTSAPTVTAGSRPTGAGTAGTATPPQALLQTGQDLISGFTSQLQQAVNSGGQPQTLTPQQVEAMLRQQLQQLGINPPPN